MANATGQPQGTSPEAFMNSSEVRRLAAQEQAQRKRQMQALNLQRERPPRRSRSSTCTHRESDQRVSLDQMITTAD